MKDFTIDSLKDPQNNNDWFENLKIYAKVVPFKLDSGDQTKSCLIHFSMSLDTSLIYKCDGTASSITGQQVNVSGKVNMNCNVKHKLHSI